MSQRERATTLLRDVVPSSDAAAALEAEIFCSDHESYNKAVRRVVAAARRAGASALPAADDAAALSAFVESALSPPARALGLRETREIRVVRATDNGGAPSRLEPPMPEDKERLALYVPRVLPEASCRELIQRTELAGYVPAMMSAVGGGQVLRPDIRDNERVILWDKDTADALWQSLRPHVPTHVDGKSALGLSEKLRFYKYDGSRGQSFAKHIDDSTVLDGQQSQLTVLVYLNEGFEGGHTRLCVFDDRFVDRSVDVQPATGAAFVFDHRILHAGMPVTRGLKYAMRTDVLYSVRRDADAAGGDRNLPTPGPETRETRAQAEPGR